MEFEDATDDWHVAGWHVRTTWTADPRTDRTNGVGFLLRNERTARRLVRAINDGAVFTDVERRTDINGHTYIAARSRVMARCANADLRRLGY
jgi:hypothetical protein